MNPETTAAISSIADHSKIDDIPSQAIRLLKWCVLSGEHIVCTVWDFEARLDAMDRKREECWPFATVLFSGGKVAAVQEKEFLLSLLNSPSMEEAVERYLHILRQLTGQFHLYEAGFSTLFPERADYFEKLSRLGRVKELGLWMNNYLCWVSDYPEDCREDRQEDITQRAHCFMAGNYVSPDMILKSVADYVGLNKKYLGIRFTKETGMTFSARLVSIRLERAKRPMDTTDLRVYEISDHIGYRNVEYLDHISKRAYSISPSDYKRNPR